MQFDVKGFDRYLEEFKAHGVDLATHQIFLNEESYKHTVYDNAQNTLDFGSWRPSDVGTGIIVQKVIKAVEGGSNLVYRRQKLDFKAKVQENKKRAEQLLYNLYCCNDDARSFDDLVAFLGGKYDLIGYLFFIKNDKKYLPISPSNFDKRFAMLRIPLEMSRSCSSQNYFLFIECIDTLRKHMEAYYGFEVSLLDAHSVIWQMGVANDYAAQKEEGKADAILTQEVNVLFSQKEFTPTGYTGKPIARQNPVISNGQKVYPRNSGIARNALYMAKNRCELDPLHQSFIRKHSNIKYMEPHHLVPMCESEKFAVSLDREENIICLCSNCHNEIHYGKRAKKIAASLYEKRKALLKTVGIEISLADLLKMY